MIAEMPKKGAMVRRKRDGNLYTVGRRGDGGVINNVYWAGETVKLRPVWDGRTHTKTVAAFMKEYELQSTS